MDDVTRHAHPFPMFTFSLNQRLPKQKQQIEVTRSCCLCRARAKPMTASEREVSVLGGQPRNHTSMIGNTKRGTSHRRRKICNSADSLAGIEEDECYNSEECEEDEVNESPSVVDERSQEPYTKARMRQNTAAPISTTEEQTQLLVELIAREMAAALLRQPSGSSLLSGSRSSDGTEDSSNQSSLAVGALAELVMSSVRDGRFKKAGFDVERTVQHIMDEKQQQGMSRPVSKAHLQDARSVPDGTLETEVSGSNSDLLASPDTKDFDGSSSGEIVWTPAVDEPKTDRCEKDKLEISLFPDATSVKPKTHNAEHEAFEPRIWTANDFGAKKRGVSPPVMIDPDEEVEINDFDADDLDLDADDDEISVMSDITGLTGAFDDAGKVKAKAKVTKVDEEVDAKQIKFSLADSDSFKAFAGDARKFVDNTTYGPISVKNLTIRKRETKQAARPSTGPSVKSTVSFAHVQVRHYERIMNDNPASAAGPSIGIGWRFVEADPVCVDTFEKRSRSRAQTLTDLQLSKSTRLKLVRALGYTDREIAANVRDLNKSRSNRKQTVDNLGVEKVEETVEKVKRKVRRLFSLQRQPSLSSIDSTKTPSVETDLVSV